MSKHKKVDPKKAVEVAPVEPEIQVPIIENGFFTFADGSTYEGTYEDINGTKVRTGTGIFVSGPEAYNGEWANDVMQGVGEYHFCSGMCYFVR